MSHLAAMIVAGGRTIRCPIFESGQDSTFRRRTSDVRWCVWTVAEVGNGSDDCGLALGEQMQDQRFLRFADVEGLGRRDLAVAADVWLDELCKQSWATRETIKLATHFKRYLQRPDPRMLELGRIESACNIPLETIVETLRQMYIYGALSGYSLDARVLRVSLNLSILQRLRVLETSRKFAELRAFENRGGFKAHHNSSGDTWLPPQLFGEEVETVS